MGTAVLVTLLSALAYLRYKPVRQFLTILSPAILIIPVLFLRTPSVHVIAFPQEPDIRALEIGKTDAPIVMVVFDELPLRSLLDQSGNIDSVRFPNFAALVNDATWFRNATTVSTSTRYALPAMLTGNYPTTDSNSLPTFYDYPQNLFTWFRDSHDLSLFESTTHMEFNPRRSKQALLQKMVPLLEDLLVVYLHLLLPDDFRNRLPDISYTWVNPLRQFESFLETFQEKAKPGFHFVHLQIPHFPWVYLPSGKRHRSHSDSAWFLKKEIWVRDNALVTLAFQRHLLQVGLADRLMGRLLQELMATGLYDRSLIVVVSDHGTSFRPGGRRRAATEMNFPDILSVSLLIKAPHQQEGRISNRHIEIIDIVPTISDILGVSVPWPTDGASALSGSERRKDRTALRSSQMFNLLHPTTLCLEGTRLPVTLEEPSAHLDIVEQKGDDSILFRGWAGDIGSSQPADAILLFVDAELVYQGKSGYPRPDVAEKLESAGLRDAGFLFRLDRELFNEHSEVRCFALSGERISEVNYPKSFPWSSKPDLPDAEDCFPAGGESCSLDQGAPHSYLITRSCSLEELMENRPSNDFDNWLNELAWNTDENGLFRIGP